MNLTMDEILKFDKFYSKILDQELPLQTSYKLVKLFKICREEKIFYQEKFQSYINNYAIRDEQNNIITDMDNNIKIQREKIQEFQEKIQELDNLEVKIPDFEFTFNELEGAQLTVAEMEALLPFIKEE